MNFYCFKMMISLAGFVVPQLSCSLCVKWCGINVLSRKECSFHCEKRDVGQNEWKWVSPINHAVWSIVTLCYLSLCGCRRSHITELGLLTFFFLNFDWFYIENVHCHKQRGTSSNWSGWEDYNVYRVLPVDASLSGKLSCF